MEELDENTKEFIKDIARTQAKIDLIEAKCETILKSDKKQ